MSHTNSTAHYELPQFLGTDKPAWLTDINGAMSAIDTGIYSAQTKANEADAKATQNTSDITTQGGQISTLSGKVSALETAQPVDEAQIELNRQNIATNAQNIVEIDNRLGHVDISAYGSTQTGAIKNIGDKAVNKCITTDEETIGQPSLKAYAIGEFFIGKTDRNLYKVTSAISISDVLAVGTNCSVDTIASELAELNADKANKLLKVTVTVNTNSDGIGFLSMTTEHYSVYSAFTADKLATPYIVSGSPDSYDYYWVRIEDWNHNPSANASFSVDVWCNYFD